MRGIEITDDDLAIDVIDRVGPGGEYLSDKHTLKHFRSEHWRPKRLNRDNYDTWCETDKKDMGTRLNDEVKHILSAHQPNPLKVSLKESVTKMIEDYQKSVTA
jgi:trimethylamine--corrinoid protein Co-methyltransferase